MKTIFKYIGMMTIVLLVGELIGQAALHAVTFATAANPLQTKIEADIYLNGSNTVLFDQIIVPQSADTFSAAVLGKRILLGDKEPLYILIASPGGYAEVGEQISNFLTTVPNLTLICRYCASDAGFIFATFKGPRVVMNDSQFIMHEMFMDHVTGEMLRSTLDIGEFIRRSDEFNKTLYTILRISRKEYESRIYRTEWELTGNDIAKYHIADKVVKVACDHYVKMLAPISCGVK